MRQLWHNLKGNDTMIKLAHNTLASHTKAELNAKGLSEKQIETFALKDMTTQEDIDCITKIFNEINCKEALDALGHAQHDMMLKTCKATIAYQAFKKYEADNS
tara:strand:+ start:228 stop:536 length:309 start_codon:yes stop_codon:yes gene_type:complete